MRAEQPHYDSVLRRIQDAVQDRRILPLRDCSDAQIFQLDEVRNALRYEHARVMSDDGNPWEGPVAIDEDGVPQHQMRYYVVVSDRPGRRTVEVRILFHLGHPQHIDSFRFL